MKTITVALVLLGAGLLGCAQETSHTESDQPNWLDNGHTKKETTTYKNADGTTRTESSKSSTTN
jgi:hypothetical protein